MVERGSGARRQHVSHASHTPAQTSAQETHSIGDEPRNAAPVHLFTPTHLLLAQSSHLKLVCVSVFKVAFRQRSCGTTAAAAAPSVPATASAEPSAASTSMPPRPLPLSAPCRAATAAVWDVARWLLHKEIGVIVLKGKDG